MNHTKFSFPALLIVFFAVSGCVSTEEPDVVELATVVTNSVSELTPVSAKIGGEVQNDGGATVTERGIVFGLTPNPSIISFDNTILGGGSGIGSFVVDIENLTTGTTYYARAYAINEAGTAYGNNVQIFVPQPAVGITYQGGTIFYIFTPSDPGYVPGEIHGLIVAPETLSDAAPWFCIGASDLNVPGAYDENIGSGLQNSIAIRNACSADYIAARLCLDYSVDGYDDWYLPARYEMHEMVNFLYTQNVGGYFWSSTMPESNRAWVTAYGATELYMPLDNEFKVRAVRTF